MSIENQSVFPKNMKSTSRRRNSSIMRSNNSHNTSLSSRHHGQRHYSWRTTLTAAATILSLQSCMNSSGSSTTTNGLLVAAFTIPHQQHTQSARRTSIPIGTGSSSSPFKTSQLEHLYPHPRPHTILQSTTTNKDSDTQQQQQQRKRSSYNINHRNNAGNPRGFSNSNSNNNSSSNSIRNGKKKNGSSSSSSARRTDVKYRSNDIKMRENTRAKTYKEIKEFRKAKMNVQSTVGSSGSVSGSGVRNGAYKMDDSTRPTTSTSQDVDGSGSSQTFQEHDKTKTSTNNPNQIPHRNANVKKRIHDMHTIRSSRTFEEQKRSSDRINKARVLLRDLSDDSNGVGGSPNGGIGANFDATGPTTGEDEMDATDTDVKSPAAAATTQTWETKTIPDRFWYNGNLQQGQGDYVTRWAQGVKVAEPLRKYDPIAAEKILFRQPTKWLVRNVQIGFPLATWAIGVALDVVRKKEQQNRVNRAKQLLETISGLGPAIIKGGQALASRSDLMPSEYLDQLQKLQDDVPRFDNGVALATVEEELQVNFDDVFELVEKEPIAAASIGQVYKARLRRNGDLVALKIQRPKCEEIIALDLYVLRWWSGVANILTKLLNRDIDVQSIIDDFGELIYRELDYVAEAANAQRFSELYASTVKDVFVPKVYSELTTSKVLTMEWVEGFRLTDSDSLNEYGLDRKKLVDTLVQCSLRQILGNGKFLEHTIALMPNIPPFTNQYIRTKYQGSFTQIHMLVTF